MDGKAISHIEQNSSWIGMEELEPEICVPIDVTNLKAVIPPGEKIIYSTLATGSTMRQNGTLVFDSHMLITTKGIAIKFEDGANRYCSLREVQIFYDGFSGDLRYTSITVCRVKFSFKWEARFETKEEFNQRVKNFAPRYWPMFIQLKKQYLAEHEVELELSDRIKDVKGEINEMIKVNNVRLAKAEKNEEVFSKTVAEEKEKQLKAAAKEEEKRLKAAAKEEEKRRKKEGKK